jgi:uncharacterized repeat protein (TIGR01451 family)
VVPVLALTATAVAAATSPYAISSFWMADPLFSGTPGDPTSAQPGDTVPGYWYRDTTNQNALAQYTQDQFTNNIVALYNSATLNVYEYISAGGTNVTLITSGSDYMIFGCGGSTAGATLAKNKLYGLIAGKTLRGVVMPDSYYEDTWGCKTWTKGQSSMVIYANAFFDDTLERGFFIDTAQITRREAFYGMSLPSGSDGSLGAGAMGTYQAVSPQYYQEPTARVSSQTDITLGDATIRLIPTLDEDAGLMAYLPEPGIAIIGEFYGHFLPDLGLGDPLKAGVDPSEACVFLDSLRKLAPNILVYKSGQPVIGAAEVQTAVIAQRDGLQNLRDQTLLKINQGYPVDEIVATTHLTDALAASPYNQEYASDQASIIRYMYSYYMGWFDGEPIHLADTLSNTVQAQMLADAYGGVNTLIAAAKQTELAASDQPGAEKALYLAYSAYKLSPANFEVQQIYAQALRKVAFMENSAYKRNYYLSTAQNLGLAKQVSDISKTGQEDMPLTFTSLEFSQHFSNISGAALVTIKIVSLPDAATGALSLAGVGVTAGQEIAVADLGGLVFTPAANWDGQSGFLWNANDGSGYVATDANVHLTFAPANDAPVVATPLTDLTIDENGSYAIDLTGVFTDIDGDVLTYTVANNLASLISTTVDGTNLALQGLDGQHGTAIIQVTAADPSGQTATDDFTVTVNPVNSAPWAHGADFVVTSGKARTFALEYGDAETAPQNLAFQTVASPAHGVLAGTAPTLTYTAQANYIGDDSFTYSVSDRGDPDGCAAVPCSPARTSEAVTVTIHVVKTGVAGRVFDDKDADGTLDRNEAGLAGVTIQLIPANGSPTLEATTGADGAYAFDSLPAGSYRLHQVLRPGYIGTTPDPIDITLAEGQALNDKNFGAVTSADLQVGMKVEDKGLKLIYTISVTNKGPADALDVSLTDPRPEGLAILSLTSTQGKCRHGKTVECNFGKLASGSSATVTLIATRISLSPITNTATASSSVFDIVPGNNSAGVTVPSILDKLLDH